MADRNARGEFLPQESSKRKSISTRLSEEELERFRAAVEAAGEQPTIVLRRLILEWTEAQEAAKRTDSKSGGFQQAA